MTQSKWTYRVGYEFTGGPTHPAGSLPGDPPRWTGAGSSGCDVERDAPLTAADWPGLAEDIARSQGFADVTIVSAMELRDGDAR